MSNPKTTAVRADDLLRHLKDLRSGIYEGAQSRSTKDASLPLSMTGWNRSVAEELDKFI
jgi:hypothetical protein